MGHSPSKTKGIQPSNPPPIKKSKVEPQINKDTRGIGGLRK